MSLLVIGTLAYDDIETAHDTREGVLGGSADGHSQGNRRANQLEEGSKSCLAYPPTAR